MTLSHELSAIWKLFVLAPYYPYTYIYGSTTMSIDGCIDR
jgi:hypothetical protein